MRIKKRRHITDPGLDSLVDIVTNSVGVLIIMAAFMAILTQFSSASSLPKTTQNHLLKLPWSHPSDKKFALFALTENKLHYLDLKPFYLALADTDPSLAPIDIITPDAQLNIRFFPVSNQIYCIEIKPQNMIGETWSTAQAPSSHWQMASLRHDPAEFIYFFWVTPDSFAQFHQIRTTLQAKGIEVGWMPHRPTKAWEYCNGFGGTAAFRPQ